MFLHRFFAARPGTRIQEYMLTDKPCRLSIDASGRGQQQRVNQEGHWHTVQYRLWHPGRQIVFLV